MAKGKGLLKRENQSMGVTEAQFTQDKERIYWCNDTWYFSKK